MAEKPFLQDPTPAALDRYRYNMGLKGPEEMSEEGHRFA
jgi:hypothetical protein